MSNTRDALIDRAMGELELVMSYRRRNVCDGSPVRDISIPQFHALILLQEHGPRTLSDLAHDLCISAPSASSIVDRMEEHGYVVRARDSIDRRVVHVSISAEGRSVIEEIMGVKRDHSRRVLEVMTENELETVLQFVDVLRSALERLGTREPSAVG
jgi:MarR family transcriptional regulator, organic hydroperoxide resistance regulator